MPTGTQPLPSRLSQEVGRLLHQEITARGISQAHVAAHSGISASQLSRALAGKKPLTLDQLDALCATIGCDLVVIVDMADRATRTRRRPGELIVGRFGGVGDDKDDLREVAAESIAPPHPDETDADFDA